MTASRPRPGSTPGPKGVACPTANGSGGPVRRSAWLRRARSPAPIGPGAEPGRRGPRWRRTDSASSGWMWAFMSGGRGSEGHDVRSRGPSIREPHSSGSFSNCAIRRSIAQCLGPWFTASLVPLLEAEPPCSNEGHDGRVRLRAQSGRGIEFSGVSTQSNRDLKSGWQSGKPRLLGPESNPDVAWSPSRSLHAFRARSRTRTWPARRRE